MRIISGTARGRKLKEPAGYNIRPTSDLVKESIFNIIQFDIEGRRVLDLYAGTGQLGMEAMSRGAAGAVFIDNRPEAVKLIWENIKLCGFSGAAVAHTRDALKYLERCDDFDIIFIDPPYSTPLAGLTVEKIIEFDKLNANGIMICETKADSSLPAAPPPYRMAKEYIYGSVKITRYERGL